MSKVLNIDGINGTATDGIELSVNSTRRLFINSSGNVGIGTNSPSNRFVVSNSGGNGIEINPSNGEIFAYNRSTLAYSNIILSSDAFIVRTNGSSERLRINSSGDVGIGTNFPLNKLHVSQTVNSNSVNTQALFEDIGSTGGSSYQQRISIVGKPGSARIDVGTTDSTTDHFFNFACGFISCDGLPFNISAISNYPMIFSTYNTERLRITSSGEVGIGTSSPSTKLHIASGNLRLDDNQYILWGGNTNGINGNNSSNLLAFYTNSTERLRITSNGNIGIGETSPSTKLHISGASGTGSELRIACTTANNGGKISFYESTSAAFEIANTSANGALYIRDTFNNSERFRISNTGFIGIGTSSPGQVLDVNGNLEVRGWTYMDANYGHSVVGLYAANRIQGVWAMGDSYKIPVAGTSITSAYGIGWSHPNANAATGVTTRLTNHGAMIIINGVVMTALSDSIYCAGNITAYSDERVKTNWRNLTDNFVEKLAKVKNGIFDRVDFEHGNPNKTQVGVSAQSLREILPEAIIEEKDEAKSLSVSYGNAALAACVELAKEIINIKEQHKKEILELKSLIQSKV